MRYIDPHTINLVSSSITEPSAGEPAVYNPATTYNAGSLVIYDKRRWKCLDDGVFGVLPGSDPLKWSPQGPTNRWAMFDTSVSTVSSSSTDLVVLVNTSRVDSVALLNIVASSVLVELLVSSVVVWSSEQSLYLDTSASWSDYFFTSPEFRRNLILSIPIYLNAQVRITLRTSGGVASCGWCTVGRSRYIGKTLFGVSLELLDYSRKEVSDDGVATLEPGAYAHRLTAPVMIATPSIDAVTRQVAAVRGRAVVWVADDTGELESMATVGFCQAFSPVIQGAKKSEYSLEVIGLA